MRAVVATRWGPPSVLDVRDVEVPEPISTEVRCRVLAAGVNPVDAKTRRGLGVARWVGPPPVVLGWEFVGVVDKIGYGVTRFAPGDVIFGMPWFPRPARCHAEWICAPSRQLAAAPVGIDPIPLAGLPLAGLTAWQSLVETAQLSAGDRLIVLGASGTLGRLSIQLAATLGADVSAVVRDDRHAPRLEELGATEVVTFGHSDRLRPARVVMDLVGGDTTAHALDRVEQGGIVLAVADGAPGHLHDAARARQVSMLEPLVEPDGSALSNLAQRYANGTLAVDVADILPFAQAVEAHTRLERGAVGGKLLLVPSS